MMQLRNTGCFAAIFITVKRRLLPLKYFNLHRSSQELIQMLHTLVRTLRLIISTQTDAVQCVYLVLNTVGI
jgi:hypothetical protein